MRSHSLSHRPDRTLLTLARLMIACIGLGAASLAAAHPAPFSYLDLHLEDERIHGSLVIHDFDAAYELKIGEPALLLDPSVAHAARDTLIPLINVRLRLLADDDELVPSWGAIETLPERQSLRLPFVLDRPVRGKLDMVALLFPYDANHQTFINIYEGGELKLQAILDSTRRSLRYYSGSAQGRWAVVTTFATAGVHHILIGPDHVLFLLGLLLLGGSWWRLATIVTAFTIGHSITLSLAVLGVVRLPPAIVEPAIALSIIVVGVDNLLVSRQRRATGATTRASRDLRPWMAGAFGLIHGFGFAAVLVEFGLPREALGWSLAAFNIGVEAGQLFIVVMAILLARFAIRLPLYRPAFSERFLTLASMAVIAAGVYWLTQRIALTPTI
jgi:hydrogenase/urease accessory protein HupE